jgi:hypothetical protein
LFGLDIFEPKPEDILQHLIDNKPGVAFIILFLVRLVQSRNYGINVLLDTGDVLGHYFAGGPAAFSGFLRFVLGGCFFLGWIKINNWGRLAMLGDLEDGVAFLAPGGHSQEFLLNLVTLFAATISANREHSIPPIKWFE